MAPRKSNTFAGSPIRHRNRFPVKDAYDNSAVTPNFPRQFRFNMTEEDWNFIKAEAERREIAVSAVLRDAVDFYAKAKATDAAIRRMR